MILSLRTLLRHPLQFAIMTLGIALGVAVMVSIDLANASALRAFDLSASAVTGRATHAIIASGDGVDESVYVRLRTDPQWQHRIESAPLVMTYVVSPQLGEVAFTLLGIDPLAEAPFRSYLGASGEAANQGMSLDTVAPMFLVPGSVLLSAPVAEHYGLRPCPADALNEACRLELSINGEMKEAYLTGLLEPSDDLARRALDTLILADIATAQSLTGSKGKLTQIDLILPEGFDEAVLAEDLPAGTQLVASELRTGQVAEMTAAFRVNLTALSLLALVGALGSLAGLGLGILLGQGAVRMVTQTINDLFFVVTVRGIQVPLSTLLKGGLAGLLASLLAAAPPAWEAASVPPRLALSRAGLESKVRSVVNMAAVLGIVLAVMGALVLNIPTRDLTVSFAGTSAVTLGLAMLSPLATVVLMRLFTEPLGRLFGFLGRLAPRNVVRSQSRTAVAAAALMVAVSVTIGVQVMIHSFRGTVTLWLEQTLRGDVYISAQGFSATRSRTPLEPGAIDLARSHPQVASSSFMRGVTVESEDGPVELIAVSTERPMDERLFLAARDGPSQAWQSVARGAILLSEPLAARLGIDEAGGTFNLLTPNGWQSFPIAGIYADYASTRGTVRMSLDVYRALWDDESLNGVALFFAPGADPDEFTADLRSQLKDFPNVQVNPSGALREGALEVFERTFAITTAMQLVTTLVAFIGVLSSLLALQLEKRREMGVLRALGLTLAEMRRLTLWETGLLGASAGLLALPTGYILAWILVFIINRRSFGWTLQMQAEPAPFIQAFLLAVAAALLAAIYPAWRLSRMQAAEALRGE